MIYPHAYHGAVSSIQVQENVTSSSYRNVLGDKLGVGLPENNDMSRQVGGRAEVEDVEVRRLEERITNSERLGEARLETAMARIETSLVRISEQTISMRQELQEQRADARSLRSELHSELATGLSQFDGRLTYDRAEARTRHLWLMGTLIAGFVGLGGLLVGVKQIWIAGVQSGQTLQSGPSQVSSSKP